MKMNLDGDHSLEKNYHSKSNSNKKDMAFNYYFGNNPNNSNISDFNTNSQYSFQKDFLDNSQIINFNKLNNINYLDNSHESNLNPKQYQNNPQSNYLSSRKEGEKNGVFDNIYQKNNFNITANIDFQRVTNNNPNFFNNSNINCNVKYNNSINNCYYNKNMDKNNHSNLQNSNNIYTNDDLHIMKMNNNMISNRNNISNSIIRNNQNFSNFAMNQNNNINQMNVMNNKNNFYQAERLEMESNQLNNIHNNNNFNIGMNFSNMNLNNGINYNNFNNVNNHKIMNKQKGKNKQNFYNKQPNAIFKNINSFKSSNNNILNNQYNNPIGLIENDDNIGNTEKINSQLMINDNLYRKNFQNNTDDYSTMNINSNKINNLKGFNVFNKLPINTFYQRDNNIHGKFFYVLTLNV